MGRPTDALKHRFQRMLESSNADKRFMGLLKAAKDDLFLKAYEVAHDRGYGKPVNFNENTNYDDPDRIPSETLLETIRNNQQTIGELRKQLEDIRKGLGLEKGA
jgi:hypothetical protein